MAWTEGQTLTTTGGARRRTSLVTAWYDSSNPQRRVSSMSAADREDGRRGGTLTRRHGLLRSLERAQRLLVHLIDDLGVRSSGRLETRPGDRVGRFAIGVEVMEELAGRDPRREAIQASEIARRRTWIRFGEKGNTKFLEGLYRDGGQLGPRRSARVPLLRGVHVRPAHHIAREI